MILKTAVQFVMYGERGIVLNKPLSKSLRKQLFFSVLLSLVLGILAFGLAFLSGNFFLDKTIYSYSFDRAMADRYFEKLQAYVQDETISLNNLHRLNAWCNRGEKVYLTLYKDDILIYEFPFSNETSNNQGIITYHPDTEDPDSEYALVLFEDIPVRCFLYYYAGDGFYFWLTILSVLVGFLIFSSSFIFIVNRRVLYIEQLKLELDILSGGQLEYPVTIKGKDELSELALGIDQMRCSILKHQELERKIHAANSELITSMSHDLRTPLTSLLAYLEIIQRKKFSDENQLYTLVYKCLEQTLRIKQMADKQFEYFFVYATDWTTVMLETIDADMLFQQVLEDYIFSLESRGFSTEKIFSQVSGKIKVNTELMQRALDNIYSNLLKYADINHNIYFLYKEENHHLLLSITNTIKHDTLKKQSTQIGLNTCRKIIEHHHGIFTVTTKADQFHVSILLPLTI